MNRASSLTAGGAKVHRENRRPLPKPAEPEHRAYDDTEKYESFTMLAKMLHRTALVPLGPRWLWGCTCGEHGMTPMGSASKAALITQTHVLDKAEQLMAELQPTEPSEE